MGLSSSDSNKLITTLRHFPHLSLQLCFLRLSLLLFPASDYRHPVSTPAVQIMSHLLSVPRFSTRRDFASGLFVAALFAEVTPSFCLERSLCVYPSKPIVRIIVPECPIIASLLSGAPKLCCRRRLRLFPQGQEEGLAVRASLQGRRARGRDAM